MGRRYRRKKNNVLNIFLTIILLFLIGILLFKIYNKQIEPKTSNNKNIIDKNNNDTKDNKDTKNKEDSNNKTSSNSKEENNNNKTTTVTDKSSTNEKKENKNEQARRGGKVNLVLLGEENITISKGSKYTDKGFEATYEDGTDASSEVEVDNTVDTSKEGTYTVTYSVGNYVIIRRVTVE